MTAPLEAPRDPRRLSQSLQLVLRRYAAQITRRPWIAIPALLLPALGDVLTVYAPPLVVAKILGAFAREAPLSLPEMVPYILTFAGLWLAGPNTWRVFIALMVPGHAPGGEGG